MAWLLLGTVVAQGDTQTPARTVDPLVGVLASGSCVQGPCLPFSSIYPAPDTLFPYPGREWTQPSGYHHGDPVVGFSQLHLSGTGGHPSFGNFLVSPRLGAGLTEEEHASPFEILDAKCFAHRSRLVRWDIGCAVSAEAHSALYEFTFPVTNDSRIVIDVARKLGQRDGMIAGNVTFDPDSGEIRGGGEFDRNWNPNLYRLYFCARIDAKPMDFGVWETGNVKPGVCTAKLEKRGRMGCWMTFDTTATRTVRLKIAVSFSSAERAREWLDREIPAWDFAALARRAEARWNHELSAIRVEGMEDEDEKIFYSHLFHACLCPRDRTGDMPDWPAGTPFWDDQHTIWDTWKTLYPLMAIIRPDFIAGNVNSFAERLRRHGQCCNSIMQGKEYKIGQGGDDVDNIIADAFAKKIPGIDWDGAWAVLSNHAATRTTNYLHHGYVHFKERTDYCYRMKSGSGTIGFAYNDWCAAQVAAGLGKRSEAARLLARSANWTNVWDTAAKDKPSGFTGFIRARKADGVFMPTNPREGSNTQRYEGDFYEGSCWEYSFVLPHDVPGMIERMGGRDRFVQRLEYALKNNLIAFGNEPSFLTVWLFDFVGRPDLASFWAGRLRARFPGRRIPGDDDSGAMGSLYVFLQAGFFPVAGQDLYALHGPTAPKFVFRLGTDGKTFTVQGQNTGTNNIYVQSAMLNGKPLTKPFIRHADIVAGGTLAFVMGDKPSDWARQ